MHNLFQLTNVIAKLVVAVVVGSGFMSKSEWEALQLDAIRLSLGRKE